MSRRAIEFPRVFPAEFRAMPATEGADTLRIEGMASVFGAVATIWPGFTEEFMPGAFTKTLAESDQVMLWNHEDGKVLGRRSAGTVQLEQTDRGLSAAADLSSEITVQRDAYLHIKRGDVKGMSISFQVIQDEIESGRDANGDRTEHRKVYEVRLVEASPVTFPAYEATEVEARSIFGRAGLPDATTAEPVQAGHSDAGARNALSRYWRMRGLVHQHRRAI